MKLRRAMAVAAATAVIAPAAFFSAPAAFATGEDTTTTTESPSPSATESVPAPEETEATETPSDDTTEPTDEESTIDPSDGATEPTDEESTTAPTPSDDASVTTPPTSTPPSGTAKPTTDPGNGLNDCLDRDEIELDPNLHTSLSGLPDKIVAGSGFHSFKLNVSNKGKNDYKRVDLGVFTGQIDEEDWDISGEHLTLQYQDPESGKWVDISLDAYDEGAGYLGFTDVKPKESFSINLRLNVDKSAPAGLAYAISIGAYVNDKGNCVIADDEAYYEFTIVAAGGNAGEPNEAKPQGGKKPLPAKPVGNTEIKPVGSLAQTGSSSMMPALGMAGGIAIVAGAGVVFALKRRRSGDAAA